jgi:hypothetical protein
MDNGQWTMDNVSCNPKRRHNRQINEQKNDRQNANPSQNKKSCNQPHKPTQIAAHFILPKPTQHPTFGQVTT